MAAGPAQADMTLIQVAFDYRLNYPFVASTGSSANQIFTYLPQGIAYALEIGADKVNMTAIKPYDTTASLGYITTLALAWVPTNLVSQLQLALHQPLSRAYTNPDPSVNTLMLMINPTISILAGTTLDPTPSVGNVNPAGTVAPGSAGAGGPVGGDTGASAPINGRSAAIGVGAVAGAAVYAVAMFYVARRYRRNRRNSHQRASSIHATSDMAQRSSTAFSSGGMGGYFMSGANGRTPSARAASRHSNGSSSNNRSVREQGISAPILAENSLGWN